MKKVFFILLLLTFLASSAEAQWPGLCNCWGGVDEEINWWYLLDYYGYPLENGDWVYAAWTGPDGEIDPPNLNGYPTGDDLLIQYQTGDYLEYGLFYTLVTTFSPDDSRDRRPQFGDIIYCRMFDGPKGFIGPDNYYGDSQLYEVKYWPEEDFFCLFPGDPGGGHTDTPVYEAGYMGLTVHGGLDTADMSLWPLSDFENQQLEDGDLVQFIWAGFDGLADPLNENTGIPTGDDKLLGTCGIGDGYDESGTSLFSYTLFTCESEHPCPGDVIYVRVFNDQNFLRATYYGESALHIVTYQEDEIFPCFCDDGADALICNPGFTEVEYISDPGASLPVEYALHQNYPNPFNALTEIRYTIPQDEYVTLKVYNVLGQEIRNLAAGYLSAGEYSVTWNGKDDSHSEVASGIYFCIIDAGDFRAARKMVLLR